MHVRTTRTLAATVLLVLAVCGAATATTAASGNPRTSAPAAIAVTALTTRPAGIAAAAIPADFQDLMGYRPQVRHGVLVNPRGGCSSPVPLPAEFTPACAEHDLGYDLLRYADLSGHPLGSWARGAVDHRLVRRMRAACAEHEPGLERVVCWTAAHVAATAVEVNSVRQLRRAPEETLASWVVTVTGLATALLAVALGVGRRRGRMLAAAPSACTSSLGALAFVLSLAPSLLPRPAWVQAVLTGLLVAAGVGLARPLGRLERRLLPVSVRPLVRWTALSVALAASVTALAVAHAGLQADRRAVGAAPADGWYWPTALAGAAVVTVLLLLLARAASRRLRGLSAPRAAGRLVLLALLPLVVGAADGGSLLAALPYPDENEPTLSLPSRTGAVRVYVGIEEGRTPARRAALAVRRLERQGGFDREAVVVAFPTGTGWVNMRAVNGFEHALGGDVATVAVQGGTAPSWVELLVNRSAQEASAQALFRALSQRLAVVPPGHRPDLHLYGESLGALLGQSVLAGPRGAVRVCSAVWAGVPGGTDAHGTHEIVLRNPDDPVPFWSLETAVVRPEAWPRDAPWIPVLSYVTTSLDLVAAEDTASGHGHVYGREQPWRLPRSCG